MNPDKIRLTVVVVTHSIDGVKKKGLCSGYFEHIYDSMFNPAILKPSISSLGWTVRAFTKGSLFAVPGITTAPVIMIGPGCGLAPFIGYIEEREYDMIHNSTLKQF